MELNRQIYKGCFFMRRFILLLTGFTFIMILGACSTDFGNMKQSSMMNSSNNQSGNRVPMMMGHGNNGRTLQDSTGENELNIPALLPSDKVEGNDIYYTIEAQKGKTEVFNGIQTNTLRSEEHTSELQSRGHLVCRLLLEEQSAGARQSLPVRSTSLRHSSGQS